MVCLGGYIRIDFHSSPDHEIDGSPGRICEVQLRYLHQADDCDEASAARTVVSIAAGEWLGNTYNPPKISVHATRIF